MALTQQSLDGIRNDLVSAAPKVRGHPGTERRRPPNWEFVWAPLYQAVTNRYAFRQTVGLL